MENSKTPNSKKNTVTPLVIPVEKPVKENVESDVKLPSYLEILKPSEEGENWNEKLPKEGYDPSYPAMPTSSGTLL